MNLPWSNWTSRDVFPTPLSPTRMVCKDRVKRHQRTGAGDAPACPQEPILGEEGEGKGSRGWQQQEQGGQPGPTSSPAGQQIVPTGCRAPRTDGSCHGALSFTTTFGPAACPGRDSHPSEHP